MTTRSAGASRRSSAQYTPKSSIFGGGTGGGGSGMSQGLPTTAPTAPIIPSGGGIPRIRRPRKILFVVFFLTAIYYFSLRHGLGSERAIEHLESLRRQQQYQRVHHQSSSSSSSLHGSGSQMKPLGGGRGASGLWHSVMNGIGLGGAGGRREKEKPKALRHEYERNGLVVVGEETVDTEHPICKHTTPSSLALPSSSPIQ